MNQEFLVLYVQIKCWSNIQMFTNNAYIGATRLGAKGWSEVVDLWNLLKEKKQLVEDTNQYFQICIMSRVFANDPGNQGSIHV